MGKLWKKEWSVCMKKLTWLVVLLLFFIVVGCNGDDDEVTEVEDDIAVEKNDQDVVQDTNSPFDFTHFDLDVDYSETEEFSVDYESEQNGVEAVTELKQIFEQFTFDSSTQEDEVISEVVNAFGIDEDYREFDLEIRFNDGITKNYHQIK